MRTKEKKKEKRGRFIVFEGIDGSGKTTQAKRLAEYFESQQVPVLLTNEPSDSEIGRRIRQLITTGNVSQEELARLFVEDRKNHLERVILPALERGEQVVCDRYSYSNIAYQGAAGLSIETIQEQNAGFLKPDHVFFFHLPVDTALQRVQDRKMESSIYEKQSFLQKVAEIYTRLAREESNSHLIDAGKTEEEIHQEIIGFFTC